MGRSIGQGLGQTASAISEGRSQMASFNAQIAAARKRYFRLLPNKPGLDAAGKEFYTLLREKDIGLMGEQLATDIQKSLLGSAGNTALIANLTLGKNRWDNGVAPVARHAFDAWMRSATVRQGDSPLGWLSNSSRLAEMFKASSPAYERYRRIRDWNEYYNAGKSELFFGSEEVHIQFLLQFFWGGSRAGLADERVLELYNGLVDRFGAEAVEAASEKLRSGEPSRTLTIRDPQELGLPDWAKKPTEGLMYLLAESAGDKDFAITHLVDSVPGLYLEDGIARYESMLKQHGAAKVGSEIAAIRKTAVDEEGLLVSGPYEKRTRHQALLTALKLNPDPVIVAREAARAEAKRRRAEEMARYAERQKKLQAERVMKGKALAEAHLDAFLLARDLAVSLDEEELKKLNVTRARSRGRYKQPLLREYRVFRDAVHAMAGLWNEFAEKEDKNIGRLAGNQLRQVPSYQAREIKSLLSFTSRSFRMDVENLPSLAQVQAKRIAEGQLDSPAALDLSYTARHDEIMVKLKPLRKSLAALGTDRSLDVINTKRDMFKKRVAVMERQLEDPIIRPGQTEAEIAGEELLRRIRSARELAIAGDQHLLINVNKYRGYDELPPLERRTEMELYLVAAVGLWDGFLRIDDAAYLNAAKQALGQYGRRDRTSQAGSFWLVDFIQKGIATGAEKPVAPSVIQKTEIEAGRLKPEQAINFDTTPEAFAIIWELDRKRVALSKIMRVSYGSRPEDKMRRLADMKAAQEAVDAVKKKLDEFDAKNGNLSRFPQ